jgi:hypothetical protein
MARGGAVTGVAGMAVLYFVAQPYRRDRARLVWALRQVGGLANHNDASQEPCLGTHLRNFYDQKRRSICG